MSDKMKVVIKVHHLIDREESECLVSQWEVKNNSVFQKDCIGKYAESYSFEWQIPGVALIQLILLKMDI